MPHGLVNYKLTSLTWSTQASSYCGFLTFLTFLAQGKRHHTALQASVQPSNHFHRLATHLTSAYTMATYDYQIAKTVLSDKDKDRLVCLYLNRRPDGNVRTVPPFTQACH